MRSELDVRSGKAKPICSVTGLLCRGACATAEGCGGRLDDVPVEALRWAKAAAVQTGSVLDSIDLCLEELRMHRAYPGPEVREAHRLARALRAQLERCCE